MKFKITLFLIGALWVGPSFSDVPAQQQYPQDQQYQQPQQQANQAQQGQVQQNAMLKLPRIIVVQVKEVEGDQEANPIVIFSNSQTKVINEETAQALDTDCENLQQTVFDPKQNQTQSPATLLALFKLQDSIATSLPGKDASRATRWSYSAPWHGGSNWYGYGHGPSYGYHKNYPYYHHSNYGFYYGSKIYPYVNFGYYHGYPGYRHYYYHNPYYPWR